MEQGKQNVLIHGGHLLTSDGWLEKGYIYIENKMISKIDKGVPSSHLLKSADIVISAENKAVLQGLTNGHTHLGQTFMRGLAEGRPLESWLKERIWPLQKALSPEDMHLAAQLGIVENIRCGVTRIIDHHKIVNSPEHTELVCKSAENLGIRLTLARAWADVGADAEPSIEILEHLEYLFSNWHKDRINIANGPVSTWRCSPETLQKSHELAVGNNSFSHIHIAEIQNEILMCKKVHNLTPVAWLDSLEVLDSHMQLVHSVWVDPEDIFCIAKMGATVVHCPVSNSVLGSGIAPLTDILDRNIPVVLGTDGPASNDTQDIFETMKASISLARVSCLDPTVLSPKQVLRMALNGKSLQKGQPADMIIVNLNHSRAVPVHDVDSALILCCNGSDVETVMVDGQLLMHEKKLLNIDEENLFNECRKAVLNLRRRSGLD